MIPRKQTEESTLGGPAEKHPTVLPNEALWLLPCDSETKTEEKSLPPGKEEASLSGKNGKQVG